VEPEQLGAPPELEQGEVEAVSAAKQTPASNRNAPNFRMLTTIECSAAAVLQGKYSEGNYGRNGQYRPYGA
jgi:hypothetical protein